MNNQPIGILDSGIGGLSIWQEIVRQLPHESTIYFADSKNCPYGNKSFEEIYLLARRLVRVLVKKRAKLVVIACNTITVACLGKLRKEFPAIPIVGTVPVVKTAAEHSKKKKIAILSTVATAQSHYQNQLIETFAKGCEVLSIGTDKLVSLVEHGEVNSKEVNAALREILEPCMEKDIDVLALGCSHFPFLRQQMQGVLGSKVLLLDSAGAIARQVGRVLTGNAVLSKGKATHQFFTTGDAHKFGAVATKLISDTIAANTQHVRL